MAQSFSGFFQAFRGVAGSLKRIPWIIAYNAFLFLLICVALELLIGEVLFYKYAVLVINQDVSAVETTIGFKEPLYQSVIKEWQDRKVILQDLPLANSPNPFK